jgi:hypothetical protein
MINNKHFKVNDCIFSYFHHPYNLTRENERIIEVPLGQFFINTFGYEITEVGAVMGYYGFNCKEVIDTHDPLPGVIKVNAAYGVDYANKNVLSISTIEHFKSDEYNNISDNDSIFFLEKVISSAKNFLITWPLGHNLLLDNYVKNSNKIPFFIMKRLSKDNQWEKEKTNNFSYLYNSPFPYANAICCVTSLKSLL